MAHPIIDMRLRPSWLHKFFGSTAHTPEYEVARWLNKRVGSHDIEHFARSKTVADLIAEMDAADIAIGVMVARSTPAVHIDNDALAAVAEQSARRLIGVASVDPTDIGIKNALTEIERAVEKLKLIGLNIDAGFYKRPLKPDDGTLLPLYEACQALDIPVFIMSGPTTPDLTLNDPFAIDTVAAQFPKLPIIVCHGCYPHVDAMIAVAFRRENVSVSPDMYMFSPGGKLYIEAANGFMRDQYLFGSSYPFRAMRQSVEDLRAIGLSPAVLDKVSYQNACRLLKLDEKSIGSWPKFWHKI